MEYKEHRGLSPSSLALFTGCNRKYFYKKVAKFKPDPDVEDDQEALQVGKAFHQILEDTRHNLTGLAYAAVEATVKTYDLLNPNHHGPMIFAMLAKYKAMHALAGLKVLACEHVIETEAFYGIVDVVLEGDDGGWWIGDMKTAANYSASLIPTLPRHPQLSLYAAHYKELATALDLDPEKYLGCRYRLATKTKLRRKDDEAVGAFIKRCLASVRCMDIVIPKESMAPADALGVHTAAAKFIAKHKKAEAYAQNYGNCMMWFRSCEFWSRCHGKCNSDMTTLETIEP